MRISFRQLIAELSAAEFEAFLRAPGRDIQAIGLCWDYIGRDAQQPPKGRWRTWMIVAGRGFGKTRAGAEWVRALAEADGSQRIALVAASYAEARAVMVEGDSGLLSIAPADLRPHWQSSKRLLTWPNGAEARVYSAASPEALRGAQHSAAWCDEIGKWRKGGETAWDNLQLGLRLGEAAQAVATTTPRATALVRRLIALSTAGPDAAVAVSRGRTEENEENLAPGFVAAMKAALGGTRLARQELDGELIDDVEGALWSRVLIERCRRGTACAEDGEARWRRVVVGVDPPAGTATEDGSGDACGIVVAAIDRDGRGHVLADASLSGASPAGWADAVATAAIAWGADRVIAEANNGGQMVRAVLAAADRAMPVRLVHASRGKSARAEPVAALFEADRVRLAGSFPMLEDELCGLVAGGGYQGPGRSPDRADAMVWALTELMLGRARSGPRVLRI